MVSSQYKPPNWPTGHTVRKLPKCHCDLAFFQLVAVEEEAMGITCTYCSLLDLCPCQLGLSQALKLLAVTLELSILKSDLDQNNLFIEHTLYYFTEFSFCLRVAYLATTLVIYQLSICRTAKNKTKQNKTLQNSISEE